MKQEQVTIPAFEEAVSQIVETEFGSSPSRIAKMTNGICNEVYSAAVGDREVIVRMHSEPRYLFGSHNHIPIFRAKGIAVPEILAEDYSKERFPFAYQILSKIDGQDINDIISTLNDEQLRSIAGEVAKVFVALRGVPNNGKFGVVWGDTDDLVDSWAADIRRMSSKVVRWGKSTGVWEPRLQEILDKINSEFEEYFKAVEPVTYYGDICAKNVMVHDGGFSGLVDLDSLAQGDPLEAVGRIKASWYGTRHGQIYSDAVMSELRLTDEKRDLVTMYALLNRTYWTFENGVQFNRNTTPVVDREKEGQDKAAVEGLYREFCEIIKT